MIRCHTPATLRSRLRSTAASFIREEQGSATLWNVTWLLVFAGMAGLSIDSSNGYRNISISQSTSDVSSLAGVMELPHPLDEVPYDPDDGDTRDQDAIAAAKAKAVEYAFENMNQGWYGDVLTEDEVFVGHWEPATRTFTPIGDEFGSKVMNAVRVYLQQDEALRGNGVGTSLMGLVGMYHWDVTTTATAQIGWDSCIDHAMMTKQKFCENNHTNWGGDMCLYADEGFKLGPNNSWNGNEARSPANADNSQVHQNNLDDPNFSLNASDPGLRVPHVDSIPSITNQILRGNTIYTQPKNTVVPGAGVVLLGTSKVISPSESGWLDLEPSVQVADLSGFANVGALIGLSDHKGVPHGGGSDPGGGDPGGGNDDTTLKNCNGSKSPGSEVPPIEDFNKEILGIDDGIEGNEVVFDPDYDPAQGGAKWTQTELLPNRIYLHQGNKLEIEGDLSNVTIVTTGTIEIANGSVLSDVTLVGLDDRKGLKVNGNVGGESGITLGTASALCDEAGGVKIYTMATISTPSKTEFNGAMLASGGTIGFAGQASAPNGVSLYAAGHIVFASNPGGGGEELEINSCGVPVTIGEEDLKLSIVD